jgi:hypothetical protein
MTTQDANTSRGRKTWILGAGLVAIAAIVAYLGFDYPPAGDEAAGTIVPANRYRADANSGAPTGDEADQLATGDVGAIQSEAMDAATTNRANVGKADAATTNRALAGKSSDSAVTSKSAAGNKAVDEASANKSNDSLMYQ